jgi:hypothetical protein
MKNINDGPWLDTDDNRTDRQKWNDMIRNANRPDNPCIDGMKWLYRHNDPKFVKEFSRTAGWHANRGNRRPSSPPRPPAVAEENQGAEASEGSAGFSITEAPSESEIPLATEVVTSATSQSENPSPSSPPESVSGIVNESTPSDLSLDQPRLEPVRSNVVASTPWTDPSEGANVELARPTLDQMDASLRTLPPLRPWLEAIFARGFGPLFSGGRGYGHDYEGDAVKRDLKESADSSADPNAPSQDDPLHTGPSYRLADVGTDHKFGLTAPFSATLLDDFEDALRRSKAVPIDYSHIRDVFATLRNEGLDPWIQRIYVIRFNGDSEDVPPRYPEGVNHFP